MATTGSGASPAVSPWFTADPKARTRPSADTIQYPSPAVPPLSAAEARARAGGAAPVSSRTTTTAATMCVRGTGPWRLPAEHLAPAHPGRLRRLRDLGRLAGRGAPHVDGRGD